MNKYKVMSRVSLYCIFFSGYFLSAQQIHVFGDSHASFCFSNERTAIPREEHSFFNYGDKSILFNIYWLGPKTMYSVGKNGLHLASYNIQKNDIVVFVLGEIDARCHIEKQAHIQNCTIVTIVDQVASNFLKILDANRTQLDGLTCVIVSVVPPTDNAYNWQYPFYGTLSRRVEVTQLLNATLKGMCEQYGFDFLDIYNLYANDAGILDDSKGDGVVHVNKYQNDQIKNLLFDLLSSKQ